jgi:hypothetical protein
VQSLAVSAFPVPCGRSAAVQRPVIKSIAATSFTEYLWFRPDNETRFSVVPLCRTAVIQQVTSSYSIAEWHWFRRVN